MNCLFRLIFSIFFCLVFSLVSCNQNIENQSTIEDESIKNESGFLGSAQVFNPKNSDPRAIELADNVLEFVGADAYEQTCCYHWNFFGRRTWFWDKNNNMARIDYTWQDTTVIFNTHTIEGKAFVHGKEVSDRDTLNQLLKLGHRHWVNDVYWLFMPFKLKDPGVILKYEGLSATSAGESAEVIELTFEEVGYTPENRYLIYISPDDYRIMEWAFFSSSTDEKPGIVARMDDYQEFEGGLKISADRGAGKLTEIQVFENLPGTIFTDANRKEL